MARRAALEEGPLGVAGWAALALLVVGFLLAAIVLAPWRLTFSLDARGLYDDLRIQAEKEAAEGTLDWLVARLHHTNRGVVDLLTVTSASLAVVTIVQSVLWIVEIGVA